MAENRSFSRIISCSAASFGLDVKFRIDLSFLDDIPLGLDKVSRFTFNCNSNSFFSFASYL